MSEHNPLPKAFVGMMKAQLDDEYASFELSLAAPPPITRRWNSRKAGQEHLSYRNAVGWCPLGEYLDDRISFTNDPLLHAGAYYVQEASSMFVQQLFGQVIDTSTPLKVLDLCAAPGGKSTHLADLMSSDSLLVTNEAIAGRVPLLLENLTRWGAANVIITHNDPADFTALEGYFDVILIDAPCSGEGLFRKDAASRKHWSARHVEHCRLRQRRLLQAAWPALREDGVLIYMTCTFNVEENERNLEWLGSQYALHHESVVTDVEWGVEEVQSDKVAGYRFYPHKVRGEGLFASVMRKKQSAISTQSIAKTTSEPPMKVLDAIRPWLSEPERLYFFYSEKNTISAIPLLARHAVNYLSEHLRVVRAGISIGTEKHNKVVPGHALATSLIRNKSLPAVDLDLETARSYLRKQSIPVAENARGFLLASFEGFALGWLHCLEGRANNLYPKSSSIRMT